jgi:hypothetical protein
MPLIKPRRFVLVQSRANSNVTEDNLEPYHISTFRRSTSMPPLPTLISSNPIEHVHDDRQALPLSINNGRCSTNNDLQINARRLPMRTMKKKSARMTRRLSNVFGLSVHTIDEQFNFEEQRFRASEKFVKLLLRHAHICIEALRVS